VVIGGNRVALGALGQIALRCWVAIHGRSPLAIGWGFSVLRKEASTDHDVLRLIADSQRLPAS
jgi:hypothetical protein